MENLKKEGYSAYMLTLTVPNCKYEDLNSTIKKMNSCWNKFFKKYNADDLRSWKNRYVKIDGALKVLEVTVNQEEKTFHPHFHILLVTMLDKKPCCGAHQPIPCVKPEISFTSLFFTHLPSVGTGAAP